MSALVCAILIVLDLANCIGTFSPDSVPVSLMPCLHTDLDRSILFH